MPAKKPSAQPYVLRGLESKKDRKQAYDVIVSSFPDVSPMANHISSAIWKGPTFNPEHTRIAVKDGRVAGVAVMGPRMLRFGPVKIPAMTVGPVATDSTFRGQGFCSIIMNELTRYMKDNGVLLSYLAGAKALYCKYGYYGFYTPTIAKLNTKDSTREGLPGKLQTMTRKHLPAVRRIFDKATAGRIVTAARDAKVWEWLLTCAQRTWLFPGPKVILDEKGRVVGYCTQKSNAHLEELVVKQDERSLRVALGALAKHAQKNDVEVMTMTLPWNDSMFVLLRHIVGTMVTLHGKSGGGNQMMVVDFPGLMKALEPLFTQRWKEACTALPKATFNFACEKETVSISVGGSRVRIGAATKGPKAQLSRRWLTPLISGSSSVDELMQRQEVKIPAKLKPAFEILFPAGWPLAYRGDSY